MIIFVLLIVLLVFMFRGAAKGKELFTALSVISLIVGILGIFFCLPLTLVCLPLAGIFTLINNIVKR